MNITVYGAEEKCASCIHLPSASETMEWLVAAITRKYPTIDFTFTYVDIDEPGTDKVHLSYVNGIKDEEYFYPLVVLEGDVVAEGNPNLKVIYKRIEQWNQQS